MNRWNFLFLVVGVGALGWLVYDTGGARLAAGVGQLGWAFAICCALHLAALLFDAYAFKQCAGAPAEHVSYWTFVRAGVAGHAINQVTPLGALGELTKYTLLRDRFAEDRVAGALLLDNFLMFLSNCLVLGIVPPIVILALGIEGRIVPIIFVASGVMALLGVGVVLVMRRGTGAWPWRVARRLRIPGRRVDRAEAWWSQVERRWKEGAMDGRRVMLAMSAFVGSRCADALGQAVILAFLGYDHALWIGFLTLANTQVISWTTSFVPLQAGTAEGGNYLFFRAIGMNPADGVLSALVFKVRRVVFVALGIALLGAQAFRQMLARASSETSRS